MKLNLSIVIGSIAATAIAMPAGIPRQSEPQDGANVGLHLTPLNQIIDSLGNVINVPLTGVLYNLGQLFQQSGVQGETSTLLSGLKVDQGSASGKFGCDLHAGQDKALHLDSDSTLLDLLPLPEFHDGISLGNLANANISCNKA